jgi:hypothetical protein
MKKSADRNIFKKKKPDKKSKIIYHDLDHLAGSWSSEEAQEIEKYLKDQRQICEKK